MPHVRDHRAAGLQALATFFGAAGHVLVALELLAFRGATVASLSTCFANNVAERSVARHDAGRRGAGFGAVLTGLQRHQVLLFPLCQLVGTMVRARIAFPLASIAGVRAFGEN